MKKEIKSGMWVIDTTGVYEVTDVDDHYQTVYLKEVIYNDDGTYTLAGYRRLTMAEARSKEIV